MDVSTVAPSMSGGNREIAAGQVAQRYEAVAEQLNAASAAGWLRCGA